MTTIQLGAHQIRCSNIIENYRTLGIKRFCIVSPTGSGKTVIFAHEAKKIADRGEKVVILVDRLELLRQTEERLNELFSLDCSIIESGKKIRTHNIDGKEYRVFIGMVDTFYNSISKKIWHTFFSRIQYIFIDEAHERRFSKVINDSAFENATIVGFTATPIYSSRKQSMSEDYGLMAQIATENELIDDGLLVPPITIINEIDISEAKEKMGEFTEQSQKAIANKYLPPEIVVEIYLKNCIEYVQKMKAIGNEHWPKYEGKNLKAIFFGINSQHCIELYNAFNAANIKAGFILSDSKIQSESERKEVDRRFKDNEIEVLINCQIATKGYDVKDIKIVGKAFLTKSPAKDNQTSGRGSRFVVEGLHKLETAEERKEAILKSEKPFFFVLDLMSNFIIHKFWNSYKDWPRFFNGDHLKKQTDTTESAKICPKCENAVSPRTKVCDSVYLNIEIGKIQVCGHIFGEESEQKEKDEKTDSYIEADPSKLKLSVKKLAEMNIFQIAFAYKAKQCKISDCFEALKKDSAQCYALTKILEYKDEYFERYFRKKITDKNAEKAKLFCISTCETVVKKKVSDKEKIAKMKELIFLSENVFATCSEIAQMFN